MHYEPGLSNYRRDRGLVDSAMNPAGNCCHNNFFFFCEMYIMVVPNCFGLEFEFFFVFDYFSCLDRTKIL